MQDLSQQAARLSAFQSPLFRHRFIFLCHKWPGRFNSPDLQTLYFYPIELPGFQKAKSFFGFFGSTAAIDSLAVLFPAPIQLTLSGFDTFKQRVRILPPVLVVLTGLFNAHSFSDPALEKGRGTTFFPSPHSVLYVSLRRGYWICNQAIFRHTWN